MRQCFFIIDEKEKFSRNNIFPNKKKSAGWFITTHKLSKKVYITVQNNKYDMFSSHFT